MTLILDSNEYERRTLTSHRQRTLRGSDSRYAHWRDLILEARVTDHVGLAGALSKKTSPSCPMTPRGRTPGDGNIC
jgi:hypothetical protein